MDQIALVTEHIDDGRRLIERLVQEGIDVKVAGWVKTVADEGYWHLFIASSIRNGDPIKGIRRVGRVLDQMPKPFWVDPFDVRLISPKKPIVKRMLEIYQRYPAKAGIHYTPRIPDAADQGIEEAFIYPPPSAVAAE